LSGWTVFAPEHLNAKIGEKFEEKVLLLVSGSLFSNLFVADGYSADRTGSLYYCKEAII
jgi:hypothetical protein